MMQVADIQKELADARAVGELLAERGAELESSAGAIKYQSS